MDAQKIDDMPPIRGNGLLWLAIGDWFSAEDGEAAHRAVNEAVQGYARDYAAQVIASKEAELVRLREALVAVCRVFPTDFDMAEAGWSAGEINAACNVYDQCRSLTTQPPKEPT